MFKKIISSMRDSHYQQALAVAQKTLVPTVNNVPFNHYVDEAMRAMNCCAKYSGKAHMQVQRDNIVFLVQGEIKTFPAVEDLLRWVTTQSAAEFLSSTSGIPQVMI